MQLPVPSALPITPSFRLDGRRSLVAGGGRGIGAAAAAALAEAGAAVTVVARSEAEVEAVADQLRSRGAECAAAALDVTQPCSLAAFVRQRGPFDILVNSAGTNRPAALTETSDRDVEDVLRLNVHAALYLAREVARGLIHAGRCGSLITLSSQMGHVGGIKRSVYCASKHAVEGMTKALAWELGPHGIRVNTVCPTFIETELTAPMLREAEFRAYVESKIALGRIGRLEDVMGAIVFLASDAAAMVTGSALMVDGGWTAT
jgi:NAD(P)-dependent dehydrogenase (short-subunit alcohol dehydrogenase family)